MAQFEAYFKDLSKLLVVQRKTRSYSTLKTIAQECNCAREGYRGRLSRLGQLRVRFGSITDRPNSAGAIVTVNRWFASFAILVSACVPFGDAWFDFDGTVRTTDGRPIPGATVTIFVNGKSPAHVTTISGTQGRYKLFKSSCPCNFAFELVVTKEGFKQARVSKSSKEANSMKTLDVTLEADTNN